MALTLREALELGVHKCVVCIALNLWIKDLNIPTPRRNWKDHMEHMKSHPALSDPEDCDCG